MADKIAVQQALYGYNDGHRLLASSLALKPEVQRQLRTISDAAFDGSFRSYLTLYPLPSQKLHAFVKTWAAPDWVRPGSVWAHALLIDNADIARIHGLADIRSAFCRPMPSGRVLTDADLGSYRQPIYIRGQKHVGTLALETEQVERILCGLYGSEETVRVQVATDQQAETMLLAIFEQQWPRLRRGFVARTRGRPSQLKEVDLELVERRVKASESVAECSHPRPSWVPVALADLKQPNSQFRDFLQLGGAEGSGGRVDFAPLAEIYASGPDPMLAAQTLAKVFPSPTSQRPMKRMLFGGHAGPAVLPNWPEEEADRIRLALATGPALDYSELKLGGRIVRASPYGYRQRALLGSLELNSLTVQNIEALVVGIVDGSSPAQAIELALSQPDLGLLLVSKKTALLEDERIWSGLDNDLLIDLVTESSDRQQSIGVSLLESGSVEPLARICSGLPDIWWRLLRHQARRDGAVSLENCRTLKSVLTRIGIAALDSPPERLETTRELATLVLTSDLSSGLWRRAKTPDWITAMRDLDPRGGSIHRDFPPNAVDRVFSVALVSAANSGSPSLRKSAWTYGFGFLHHALATDDFDGEAWNLLASTLPAGTNWDRCQRLRRGAAAEVRRDEWVPDRVRDLIEAAHPHEGDLFELISEKGRKKDSFLKALLKLIR